MLLGVDGIRMRNAAIIVIAVPVMYFVLMDRAHSITPVRSSPWLKAMKLARRRIVATGTITISLRISMVMFEPAFPCILARSPS